MVLVDVWATWCSPCKAESPFFEKLADKYGSETIKFISISIDSDIKLWESYLAEHDKKSTQYICNRTALKDYILLGVPRFMLINKEGKFIDAFAPVPLAPAFEKLIIVWIALLFGAARVKCCRKTFFHKKKWATILIPI